MKEEETFEKIMEQIEAIAQELEKGDLSLEDSVQKFEKGMALSAKCKTMLDETEKRITVLVKAQDGTMQEENFTAEA